MYRIVSTSLVIMALLLGLGTFVSAQTCPRIAGDWQFESKMMGYLISSNDPPVSTGPRYPITKSGTWKFYQDPGDCFFWAYRYVDTASGPTAYVGEENYITGVIYGDGSKIAMTITPSNESPPGTYFGEIQFSGKRKVPRQITYVGHAFVGDLNVPSPLTGGLYYGQVAFTSTGRIYK